MRHFSGRAACRAGIFGFVALTGVAVTANAQAATQRPVAPDTTLVAPPKQPDAVPRPAGPVVVPGAVRPALAPDQPFAVVGPRPMVTPPADPDAPRAMVVPAASANVAETAPQVPQAASAPRVIVNVTTPPAGSTARCKDGSYIGGAVSANSCADKGGLGVILPELRPVPTSPRP